jgi:TonB family protein
MFRRAISVCLVTLALPAYGSIFQQGPATGMRQAFNAREYKVWTAPLRTAEFSDIPYAASPSRCQDTQPPEALTTPDPLVAVAGARITVSFIVGTDGRVHGPLILQSGGVRGDRDVLQTVRTWRYRPATCNGVPTEAEGKIEFCHP